MSKKTVNLKKKGGEAFFKWGLESEGLTAMS